jgi:hypothetical protein
MKKPSLNGIKIENEFDSNKFILILLIFLSKIIGKRLFLQVDYEYMRGGRVELKLVDLLDKNIVIREFSFPASAYKINLDSIEDSNILEEVLENLAQDWKQGLKLTNLSKKIISLPLSYKFLKISNFVFSPNIQKEIFELIVADWQEEYFEALSKKEIWKARWINVRYTYAFIVAMWQKSPIGDLIEFIQKFAK